MIVVWPITNDDNVKHYPIFQNDIVSCESTLPIITLVLLILLHMITGLAPNVMN